MSLMQQVTRKVLLLIETKYNLIELSQLREKVLRSIENAFHLNTNLRQLQNKIYSKCFQKTL